MKKITLLHAENVISRRNGKASQKLAFSIQIEGVGYHKTVEVEWSGEDGERHLLAASYIGHLAPSRECWRAAVEITPSLHKSLPGNVNFSLRYSAEGESGADAGAGAGYELQADAGVLAAPGRRVLLLDFAPQLSPSQAVMPITVAVDKTLVAEKVTIYWSSDGWKTVHKSACHFHRSYWDTEHGSNARNPNQYGAQIWIGSIHTDHAYRVEYCICCEGPHGTVWDNNQGANYCAQHALFKVMILNLHCYQEVDQDAKFSTIARVIDEVGADVVCLQEVAELWNDGQGDWETNSARIINSRLMHPYTLASDWSHIGFDKYREGVAVLSRFPIQKQESRYVSASDDPYSIHSRKVMMAQVKVPDVGLVNVYSSHLSWWEDGFAEQFGNLRRWAASQHNSRVCASLLCGDFNIKAGSRGYELVVDSKEYEDQFLAVNSPRLHERIFGQGEAGWQRLLEDDHRIDYVFLRKSSALRAVSARALFTGQDYGTVSDHFGYLVAFEVRSVGKPPPD